MAPKVDDIIAMLRKELGPQCARFVAILERARDKDGLVSMSMGTWETGHPVDIEEWAKSMADIYEELAARTPGEISRDTRLGENWLEIDHLECEKSRLLQFLGRLKFKHPAAAPAIDEWVSRAWKDHSSKEHDLVNIGMVMGKCHD